MSKPTQSELDNLQVGDEVKVDGYGFFPDQGCAYSNEMGDTWFRVEKINICVGRRVIETRFPQRSGVHPFRVTYPVAYVIAIRKRPDPPKEEPKIGDRREYERSLDKVVNQVFRSDGWSICIVRNPANDRRKGFNFDKAIARCVSVYGGSLFVKIRLRDRRKS